MHGPLSQLQSFSVNLLPKSPIWVTRLCQKRHKIYIHFSLPFSGSTWQENIPKFPNFAGEEHPPPPSRGFVPPTTTTTPSAAPVSAKLRPFAKAIQYYFTLPLLLFLVMKCWHLWKYHLLWGGGDVKCLHFCSFKLVIAGTVWGVTISEYGSTCNHGIKLPNDVSAAWWICRFQAVKTVCPWKTVIYSTCSLWPIPTNCYLARWDTSIWYTYCPSHHRHCINNQL